MASPDNGALVPRLRADMAGLSDLWPRPSPGLTVETDEEVHVLSLRHLPAGGAALLEAAMKGHGIPALPPPGCSLGIEPRSIWRSPRETLVLTRDASRAAALRDALPPTPGALACVLDMTAGTQVVRLQGNRLEALLSRLVDAQSLPRRTGDASHLRLSDIAALVWRESPHHAGLLVDRAHAHYVASWLRYAAEAI